MLFKTLETRDHQSKIHVKGEKVSTFDSYLVFYKGAEIFINPIYD